MAHLGVDPQAWAGKTVLVTGHTGFKGSWLCLWLTAMGARVVGLSERDDLRPSLYDTARVADLVEHHQVDVRDREGVARVVRDARPEVVLHLAAQPYVRRSYLEPVETYATNVMGTVHVLEAARVCEDVRALVVVTSDKCYDNTGQGRPFLESDAMGGHDPYSNSKGCAELVTDAYRRSFAHERGLRIGSGRAGNVIGGGDWGEDRLIPDVMRGALEGLEIPIRRPDAVRPWQHVLNPLSGYLLLAQALLDGHEGADAGFNFGPEQDDAKPVRDLVEQIEQEWPGGLDWQIDDGPHPHEAGYLSLDSTRAHQQLGWSPTWDLAQALGSIVEWYVAYRDGVDVRTTTLAQIDSFAQASAG